MALYELQTIDEKEAKATHHQNLAGFNAIDAPILTSMAEQYERKGELTQKQLELAHKMLKKYSRQLEIINEGEKSGRTKDVNKETGSKKGRGKKTERG